MHAADPLASHRRLAAGPVVVLAARLAARHEGEVATPVAVPQRSTTHGITTRTGRGITPSQGGEVEDRAAGDGEAQGGILNHELIENI